MEHVLEIKVCGLRTPEAARAAVRSGADWLGLVFAPSVRRVTYDEARALTGEVEARWVGVFADAAPDEIGRLARALGMAAVQLHGAETADACRAARAEAGVPVWKAIPWSRDGAAFEPWLDAADVLLLDSGAGSGRPLPWRAAADRLPPPRARPLPLFLAGGLGPENVAAAVSTLRPDGVDASSRLESAPGVKDAARIRAFVAAARAAARRIPVGAERP